MTAGEARTAVFCLPRVTLTDIVNLNLSKLT